MSQQQPRYQSKLLTTEEAMAYLKIGRTTLFKLKRERRVKSTRLGSAVRWSITELDKLINQSTRS